MNFIWLKRYLPRGLYGRAALILILPVVTLQLVISIVFIQRHFEGVTVQMTQVAAREVALVLVEIRSGEPERELVIESALSLDVVPGREVPPEDFRRWYDLTGLVVIRTFRESLDGLVAIELTDDRSLTLHLASLEGPLAVTLDRRRVSATNPHQLFVNMLFFGALMTLISYIYLRNQLRPITRLAQAAEAFGRGRTIPYKPAGAAEVRTAGTAFLDMRARIERQIEQRTLLLSGVSHDLRTPLTRIKLGLSLMPEDPETAALEKDVDEMQRMIDGFLSFARGTAETEPERVDPAAFVRELVQDWQREGQAVALTLIEGEGAVMLRPLAMRRALDNLIGNAVRYGTKAEVSVAITERALRIRVDDDGPGIPADKREEAMRPFTRLDTARNQNRGTGVGLGLAIAADVARMHGGALRLSDSPTLGGLRADIVIAR